VTGVLNSLTDIQGKVRFGQAAPINDLGKISTDKDDLKRRQDDAEEAQNLDEEFENPAEHLNQFITEHFRKARQLKEACGVQQRIHDNLRLYKGRYTSRELAKLGGPETALWYPLTDRMCRTMIAFLRRTLAADEDHPLYDFRPTAVPSPPNFLVDNAVDALVQELLASIELGISITPGQIQEAVDALGESIFNEMKERVTEAVRKAKRLVDDKLEEADFHIIFDEALNDLVIYGTAIVCGPYVGIEKRQVYRGDKLKEEHHKQLKFQTIDPHRFYPSSDSTDTQDGTYVIHLDLISRKELEEARQLSGFNAEAIDTVLAEFGNSNRDWCSNGFQDTEETSEGKRSFWAQDEGIDVIKYYGCVPGELLIKMGVDNFDNRELHPDRGYEIELWQVHETIIRTSCNIDPLCMRPYHRATLYDCPGSFWGRGAPDVIEDLQRVANAAWRSLIRNMGYSSAPMFEIDYALQDTESASAPTNILPGMLFSKNSMNTNHSGTMLGVHQIDSRAGEFLQVIDRIVEAAEMALGLPRFLLGQPTGSGAARTLGGLSQLQSNAFVNIQSTIVNMDQQLLQPLLEMVHRWVVTTSDDPEIQGDAQVVTLGATSMLAREANKDRLLQTIGTLFPFAQAGLIQPDGISFLLREVVQELGLDPDRIVIDPRSAQIQQVELQQALQGIGGISGGVGAASAPGGTAGLPGGAGASAAGPPAVAGPQGAALQALGAG